MTFGCNCLIQGCIKGVRLLGLVSLSLRPLKGHQGLWVCPACAESQRHSGQADTGQTDTYMDKWMHRLAGSK